MAASAGRVLLIPKGTYNAATTYNMLDVVYYDGATYVCKQTSLGNLPTDTDYWQLMASSSGTAAQVSFDPTGTDMASTNVQNAIVEVKNNISNPNLFMNPWFTVNQRGFSSGSQTSTSSETFIVDRWSMGVATGSTLSASLSSSGLTLTASGSQKGWITQKFESLSALNGKTLTVSVLYSDGTIKHGTFTLNTSSSADVYTDSNINIRYAASITALQVQVFTGKTVTIRAVKLELGTISTVALDTAPDYTTELLKCQRYFRQINGNNDAIAIGVSQISNCLFIINSVPMRVSNPTVTATGTWKVSVLGTDYSTTSIFRTGSTSTSGIIQIAANYSGSSSHAGQSANLFSSGSASIQIDAEL